MSLLWQTAAWAQDDAEDESDHPEVIPVEKTGYAGWVNSSPYMDEPGDTPHHYNEDLMDHVLDHSGEELRAMSQRGNVSIKGKPVYATQSHVTAHGVSKYLENKSHPDDKNLPRFIRHQGNLYVDDGHHRVGAALQRGDETVHGYFYNADKHGFPRM